MREVETIMNCYRNRFGNEFCITFGFLHISIETSLKKCLFQYIFLNVSVLYRNSKHYTRCFNFKLICCFFCFQTKHLQDSCNQIDTRYFPSVDIVLKLTSFGFKIKLDFFL